MIKMQKTKFSFIKAGRYYIREDAICYISDDGDDCCIYFENKLALNVWGEKAKTIIKKMNVNIKE